MGTANGPHETGGSSDVVYRAGIPPVEAFAALFETTGWNDEFREPMSFGDFERALGASDLAVGVYDRDDRLVGVGRVLSDGALHALIVDVIVEPSMQGRGIGTAIMQRLVAHCRERGIRDVQLFCARGKREFYERLGFRSRDPEAPGMQLVDDRARD